MRYICIGWLFFTVILNRDMKVRDFFKYSCIILLALIPFYGRGETVSQKEASKIAQTFFNAANNRVMAKPNLVYNGRKLSTDYLFSPFYVYNHPAGGFVIISAENKAFPILGYSLSENFNPEALNENVISLLKQYATDIELIRYDDRITEEAIKAWGNINEYIADILGETYDATDLLISYDDAQEIVKNFETTGRIDELSSDIYDPAQWRDMVNEALLKEKNIALGLIKDRDLNPVIIHGRKGDYYRIYFGEQNDWLMRLMATEYLSYGQVADFGVAYPDEEIIEEEPFMFYEDFVAQTRSENERRKLAFDEKITPSSPVVRTVGGGKYEIFLPEEAYMARIYNLSGSLVRSELYRGSNTASVTLEGLPYGFYIVVINGVSGQPYEFKFSR